MSSVVIEGGKPLCGEVYVQGSKNAVLPILAAAILTDGMTRLCGCPRITDVDCMLEMLSEIGCNASFLGNELLIDTTKIIYQDTKREKAKKTRASILFLGAMLGRFRSAVIAYPGGCTIGNRPIDLHIEAIKALGATVECSEETLYCKSDGLKGAKIVLPFPSVGATENIILASVLAKGTTNLYNAAREPEICALCDFLRMAGAKIKGDGSSILEIEGVSKLNAVSYTLPYDRIVAGTYLTAVAAAGGEASICGTVKKEQLGFLPFLEQSGCKIWLEDTVCHIARKKLLRAGKVITEPYPGFPTDMQSQIMTMLTQAEGESCIEETIFNARFQIRSQLCLMGANIIEEGKKVIIQGRTILNGSHVTACDLRGGASLCIAGLIAEGETIVDGIEYVMRGYEDICRDFQNLGGKIKMCETVEKKKAAVLSHY